MKICGWTEEEGGPYSPGIVWEQNAVIFLENLIAKHEFSTDIFEEIEKALVGKVYQGEESQRIVIFCEDLEFPTLAVHIREDGMGQHFYIVGVGLFIQNSSSRYF